MNEQSGYQNILAERRGNVGIVTLNRPAALNALIRRQGGNTTYIPR